MPTTVQLLQEIATDARIAQGLTGRPETKQILVEIRLAARCAMQAEQKAAQPAVSLGEALRLHHVRD